MAGSRNRIGRVCGATRTNPSADEALAYQPRPPGAAARLARGLLLHDEGDSDLQELTPDCLTPKAVRLATWLLSIGTGSDVSARPRRPCVSLGGRLRRS